MRGPVAGAAAANVDFGGVAPPRRHSRRGERLHVGSVRPVAQLRGGRDRLRTLACPPMGTGRSTDSTAPVVPRKSPARRTRKNLHDRYSENRDRRVMQQIVNGVSQS